MAKKKKRKTGFKGFVLNFLITLAIGVIFYAVVCVIAAILGMSL